MTGFSTVLGAGRPTAADVVAATSSATQQQLTAMRNATAGRPESQIVVFGDSRCADLLGGDGNVLLSNASALAYALAFAPRSVVTMHNKGIGGQTSADLLARVLDLWDSPASLAIFACGHNDFNNTADTADVVWDRIRTMLDGAVARGIHVIHLGEYISTLDAPATRDKKAQLNRLAQSYWKANAGLGRWFDIQAAIVDPSNGAGLPRPGMVRDGTHYSTAMAQVVGRLIAEEVAANLPRSSVYSASSTWDDPAVSWASVNRATSPLDGSVWTAVAGAPGLAAPARADGFGTDVSATFTAQAGVCQVKRPLDTSWLNPSTAYRISAYLTLDAPVNVAGLYCQVNWFDGTNWHVAPLMSNYTSVGFASEVDDILFESAPVTFTGITFAEVYLGVQASKGEAPGAESGPLLAASGTVRLGRFTIA